MIKSFRCKDTQSLFAGGTPRRFQGIQPQCERKLLMLDAAKDLKDLQSPPGNGLEKLSGNRKDQWSIRINDQWRICFEWRGGDAYDVEIVDYH